MAKRDGVWASDPDIAGFRRVVDELQARGPSLAPKGHRFGVGRSGAAYYQDLEVWAMTPRPDVVAFRALVEELRRRPPKEFVTRLRNRLAEIASLSVADRRQAIGVADEYLEAALAGAQLPAPIAARLQAFVAGA